MTKPNPHSGNSITKLLEDRAQFVSWLTRLNSSGGGSPVPEAVRGRVRADYERRLEAVLDELRGHTAALDEQVEGLQARAAELSARESELKEQLSEAEVRHMVGEYDQTKWEGIRAELLKVLTHVHEELTHTHGEIERLSEVLGTIQSPPPAAAPEREPAPPPPVAAPKPPVVGASGAHPAAPSAFAPAAPGSAAATPPAGTDIPFRGGSAARPQPKTPVPAPAPAPRKEDQAGRTLWFPSGKPAEAPAPQAGTKLDELAFLKSVSEAPAPSPPPPPPAPSRRTSGGFIRGPDAIPVQVDPPNPATESRDRSSGSGQKTLKCGECGTLNRPTEWYCERCGAELAAL